MRRKLIAQGKGGYTLTVPIKWVREQGLEGGDDVEVNIGPKGNLLVKGKGKPIVSESHTLNVEGFDKYQINKSIRSLYKSKTDEIIILYDKAKVWDLKAKKEVRIENVCEAVCKNLIGLDIIHKEKGKLVLQCFVSEDNKKIETIEKRIFYMLIEFMHQIIENLEDFKEFHKKTYEIHDNIAKFTEYYQRIIIHSDRHIGVKASAYSLIAFIDKLTDLLRYTCDEIEKQGRVTKKVKEVLADLFDLAETYYKFFYGIDKITGKEMTEKRYKVRHKVYDEKYSISEYRIISQAEFILHINNHFYEAKKIREILG
ncbi:hypothetical protein ACFL0V_02945 [Nanoarchaeota archaeon]